MGVQYQPDVLARVWHEGRRVFEARVVSVECDGDTVELLMPEGEKTFNKGEWDDLTVQYNP